MLKKIIITGITIGAIATTLVGCAGTYQRELNKEAKEYKKNVELANYTEDNGDYLTFMIENSIISSYPEEEVSTYSDNIVNNIKKEYQSFSSEYDDFDTFLKEVYDTDNVETYANEQAQEYMKEKMVTTLVASENKIEITDEEVQEYGEKTAKENGFESLDKMIEEYGDGIKDEFAYELLYDKVNLHIQDTELENQK